MTALRSVETRYSERRLERWVKADFYKSTWYRLLKSENKKQY